jgi:tetratricopeptide (TPR) repeat protein
MPAYNALALHHLARARAERGSRDESSLTLASRFAPARPSAALDMAALVVSQGLARAERYAPLHNTAGLIAVEMGDYQRASEQVARARALAPGLVEATENEAALAVMTRSFERAERAYAELVAQRPHDYSARLGLSLSLRGQARSATDVALLSRASVELDHAVELAPERPEAYYNRAVLLSEFTARTADPEVAFRAIRLAYCDLDRFLLRADDDPAYADAKAVALERRRDLVDTIKFVRQGTWPAPHEDCR